MTDAATWLKRGASATLTLGLIAGAPSCSSESQGESSGAVEGPPLQMDPTGAEGPAGLCDGDASGLDRTLTACGLNLADYSLRELTEQWQSIEYADFVNCVRSGLQTLGVIACGQVTASLSDGTTAEGFSGEQVVAVRLPGLDRSWVFLFAFNERDGYPNLIMLFPGEAGSWESRRGSFWPIYNDDLLEVWTAVPLVGTPGTISVTTATGSEVAGTFEFEASRSGLVPARSKLSVTSGTFEARLLADFTLR